MLEGPLDECRLVNCRNPSVSSFVASYGCICYELVVLIFIDTFKIRSIMAIGDLDFLFFFFKKKYLFLTQVQFNKTPRNLVGPPSALSTRWN
jgi:hypothetical protein